jgi:histidinol dehydrogenase
MTVILNAKDADFQQRFTAAINDVQLEFDAEIENVVRGILGRVKAEGDAALIALTNQFDKTDITNAGALKLSQAAIDAAYGECESETIAALEMAAERIKSYHEKQLPQDFHYQDAQGVVLGNVWKSVETAGIYVPGGLASYPSSVLMNAVPATVAGVKNLVMVVPTPNGEVNPAVLAAAKIAGVSEIYTVGGAQAIAALAYGTETIPKVDVIAGPGNAYVATAKRLVYGLVGIDMIAGPSEILVVADNQNNPDWIAADLLSQAEHDTAARSILITDDADFAKRVMQAIEVTLSTLPREEIARKSWNNNGLVIIVDSLDDALPLIDAIAPEHLELAIDNAQSWVEKINNAGAIFMGRYTPEAIGDYIAGPSHVLPTSGTARFSSGLSVYTFLKRVSLIGCDKSSFAKLANQTARLAGEEGLGAHALSVTLREEK